MYNEKLDKKICLTCGSPFTRQKTVSRAVFSKRKHCSHRCAGAAQIRDAASRRLTDVSSVRKEFASDRSVSEVASSLKIRRSRVKSILYTELREIRPSQRDSADYLKRIKRVQGWLKGRGITCTVAPYICPYDLVSGRLRIEVKVAPAIKRRGRRTWTFNIHRHGKLQEAQVDFYVLRMEGVESKNALHLVVPAPIGVKVISITLRSLIITWARYVNRWDYIKHGKRHAK